ncbi:phage portal protein [Schleiferilactobacillus harbinensis]|uniref:Phage portal protein n=1 Tax=Schleiferilactobacillus harbinensis TaxID=304207 RepID=A0ABU7T3B0_9LACO
MMFFGFLKPKVTDQTTPEYQSVLESAGADSLDSLMIDPKSYVSANKALTNSDLYATIYQLSADLATTYMTASQPRTQTLLDHPSATTNRHAFWQAMAAQMLLDGNAYAYIWRNQLTGQPVRFEYLRPSQVSVFLLNDGTGLSYSVSFDEPDVPPIYNVPQSDMLHLRLLGVGNGGQVGRSPLLALQNELNIKATANNLTLSALAKAITSNGTLTVTNGALLNVKEKIQMSKGFMEQVKSSDGPVVLDDLTKYDPLQVNSDVSQLLSSTDWTSKQIAKAYNIPDSYLNGQGDQQSSLTMIEGMYANSLNRYARAFASEINDKLSADVDIDVQPAIDQDRSTYLTNIGAAVKNGAISGKTADWLLRYVGFLPKDAPAYTAPVAQPIQIQQATKGGDNEDDSSSD